MQIQKDLFQQYHVCIMFLIINRNVLSTLGFEVYISTMQTTQEATTKASHGGKSFDLDLSTNERKQSSVRRRPASASLMLVSSLHMTGHRNLTSGTCMHIYP